MTQKTAVLLLAHGSPDKPEDVPDFLRAVTSGRGVPAAVVREVEHRYALVGASPLTAITRRQGELLAREIGLPVYVGMRNWKPWIAEVRAAMERDGVERAVVLCMAPQNSRTSTGLYKQALLGESGAPFEVEFIESWHDQPQLIAAFAERLRAGLALTAGEYGSEPPVIFTAHSVPERTITEGDPYAEQARATAELVAAAAGLMGGAWFFAFQSQGMSGGPWIGPTVEETIAGLQELGHGGVLIQPIGFLCDHVEVLYDIDIAFKEFAAARGMKLWRAESLNESPGLIGALAELARERLQAARTTGPAAQKT